MQDLKYAFRQMANHRGFTAVAVITIALGIGANTAIFSLLYSVFWAPSPNANQERRVVVWMTHPEARGYGPDGRSHVSRREFLEWRRSSASFESLTANRQFQVTLNDDADFPERVEIQPVTPGRLTSFGVPFILGRDFVPEEGSEDGHPAIILFNRYWQSRYDADPDIIGKQVRLDGEPHTIVGVLGPGNWDRRRQPFATNLVVHENQPNLGRRQMTTVGVLKSGVTPEQAQTELQSIVARLAEQYPQEEAGFRVLVEPFRNNWLNPRTRSNLSLLMATVTLVLLIACVNVANLLLARGDSRAREIAVRGAIGASGGQIVRQLITESLALSVVGGVFGITLAYALVKVFTALAPPFSIPADITPQLYPPVLLFSLGTTLLAGLIFGCAPAWQATRQDAGERLKQSANRVSRGNKLGKTLVIAEFALALTLLAVASLVMQRYFDRTHADFGVTTENILTFDLPVNARRFAGLEEMDRYNTQLTERLSSLPGVVSVAPASGLPLDPGRSGFQFFRLSQGVPATPSGHSESAVRIAGPELFETFNIQVRQGRAFDETDQPGSPMAIMVNETFVEKFLADADPLGETLALPIPQAPDGFLPLQIVGVYHDIQNAEQLGGANLPELILSMRQFFRGPFSTFAVRATGDPKALAAAIAAAVNEIDPDMPLANVRTVEQIIEERTAFDRFEAALYGSFGVLALILAAVGIYGLMAFVVSRRTAEIGTRMAFGADRGKILNLVISDGFKLAAAGIALGALGAWQATRLLQNQLDGSESFNTGPILTAAAVLALAALAASYIPARRAAGLDPMNALRED